MVSLLLVSSPWRYGHLDLLKTKPLAPCVCVRGEHQDKRHHRAQGDPCRVSMTCQSVWGCGWLRVRVWMCVRARTRRSPCTQACQQAITGYSEGPQTPAIERHSRWSRESQYSREISTRHVWHADCTNSRTSGWSGHSENLHGGGRTGEIRSASALLSANVETSPVWSSRCFKCPRSCARASGPGPQWSRHSLPPLPSLEPGMYGFLEPWYE